MDYTADEENEIKRNRIGKLILIASILLILLACSLNGGNSAVAVGAIGLVGFFIGFYLTMGNKSKSQIDENKQRWKDQMEIIVQANKLGASPKTISDAISGMGTVRQAQNSGTKEIIKGAVIGGIVAGDAGAVVGATIAKNKLDNENKGK